jgi:hypothetical protein
LCGCDRAGILFADPSIDARYRILSHRYGFVTPTSDNKPSDEVIFVHQTVRKCGKNKAQRTRHVHQQRQCHGLCTCTDRLQHQRQRIHIPFLPRFSFYFLWRLSFCVFLLRFFSSLVSFDRASFRKDIELWCVFIITSLREQVQKAFVACRTNAFGCNEKASKH